MDDNKKKTNEEMWQQFLLDANIIKPKQKIIASPDYNIIEQGDYKYIYLSKVRRIKMDRNISEFSKIKLQELIVSRFLLIFNIKKWHTASWTYEIIHGNIQEAISSLELQARRIWDRNVPNNYGISYRGNIPSSASSLTAIHAANSLATANMMNAITISTII